MTTQNMPMCGVCVHLHRRAASTPGTPGRPFIPWRCDAFRDRIPDDILSNEVDHRRPVWGDRGVRWWPRDSAAVAYLRTVIIPMFAAQAKEKARRLGEEIEWTEEDEASANYAAACVSGNPQWLPLLTSEQQERVKQVWAERGITPRVPDFRRPKAKVAEVAETAEAKQDAQDTTAFAALAQQVGTALDALSGESTGGAGKESL